MSDPSSSVDPTRGFPLPPIPPQATNGPARSAGRGSGIADLVLASLLLVVSLAAGIWLIVSSHSIAREDLSVSSHTTTSHSAYGGDAYTGIQNAAADTANGVADLARFESANARVGRREESRTNIGIGFVVIAIGVANLNASIRRRTRAVS